MPFAPPFLHPADAVSHAPAWFMALCIGGGAALGIALTSGGDIVRKVRHRPPAGPFRLERWGEREGAWWAELESREPGLPVDGWRLITSSASLAPLVEPLPSKDDHQRFGLVATIPADSRPLRLDWRAGERSWSYPFEGSPK